MKKIISMLLVVVLLFSLSACDKVSGILDEVQSASGSSSDDIYSDLSSLMTSPDIDHYWSKLSGKFTFSALLISDAETMELDDGDAIVQMATIERNIYSEKYMLVDVEKIENQFAAGTYVSITGELDGTIYWTEEGSRVEVIYFIASEMTEITPSFETDNTAVTIDYKDTRVDAKYEFISAEYVPPTFSTHRPLVVLYFNYTSNGSESKPGISMFDIYQGDNYMTTSFSSNADSDFINPSALDATNGFGDSVYADKTDLCYVVLSLDDSEAEYTPEAPLFIEMYDDDFNMTYQCTLPIAEAAGTEAAA